jgi:hypothetical protein
MPVGVPRPSADSSAAESSTLPLPYAGAANEFSALRAEA